MNLVFPYYFHIGSQTFHPHFVFDIFAYFIGYQVYRIQRKKNQNEIIASHSLGLLISAISGAFIVSKILAWLEHPEEYLSIIQEDQMNIMDKFYFLTQGKTIVGGIVGGWWGVELYKKYKNIPGSSGDYYAIPLCIGMIIGRFGCFLSGLEDKTHGVPSTMPWAIDFGDGIIRHPTQLYEVLFLITLLVTIVFYKNKLNKIKGNEFTFFLFAYFLFRFLIEFLKPNYKYPWCLSMIQSICLIISIYLGVNYFLNKKKYAY